jgi:hypothetical protein
VDATFRISGRQCRPTCRKLTSLPSYLQRASSQEAPPYPGRLAGDPALSWAVRVQAHYNVVEDGEVIGMVTGYLITSEPDLEPPTSSNYAWTSTGELVPGAWDSETLAADRLFKHLRR